MHVFITVMAVVKNTAVFENSWIFINIKNILLHQVHNHFKVSCSDIGLKDINSKECSTNFFQKER